MVNIDAIAWAFPVRRITNEELRLQHPDWDFGRLTTRTGVTSRHVAAEGETALDLAVQACRQLDSEGKLRGGEIDAVIFCTLTPDYIVPPNACVLHQILGLETSVVAFDMSMACSGFVYGLQVAAGLIAGGAAKRVLLVNADTYTRYIHPGDRATACLFGDGGAATIVSESTDGRGVKDIRCGTAGSHHKKFLIPAGGMRTPRTAETAREVTDRHGNVRTAELTQMDGMGVLGFFNSTVPASLREILSRNSLTMADIDLFVFHQASKLALDGIQTALQIPAEKMLLDIAETGNLNGASIPVALGRAMQSGRAKRGQKILLCGFGAGLSWGTAVLDL
jgi:3-oxoacyl-[acyl-carrier-protein] synthase-3